MLPGVSAFICDRSCKKRACRVLNLTTFQTFGSHNVLFQYGAATKFSVLIIYLALKHCLQNSNATFQYCDMSHQMTWYILAHMPYFHRPGHI